MVNQWLQDATAQIDAALAHRGYYVPLQAAPSYSPPPGMPLYQGIGIEAWRVLNSIAAAYAAHNVEAARHGAVGSTSEDTDASTWLTLFTNSLASISNGTVNLTAFGVDGAFTPQIDPAKALSSGNMGFTGNPHRPYFWRRQNLGSGWEDESDVGNFPGFVSLPGGDEPMGEH